MGETWQTYCADEQMKRMGSDEHGYRYQHAGRDWICANRCEFCGDFGVYSDTRRCPDCEGRIEAITAPLRARNEALEAALREIADYVPAVRSGDAGAMARIARAVLEEKA